ncbi:MAG: TIGR03086 family metal-binding protein [Ilumatobacteraceae bacterium]
MGEIAERFRRVAAGLTDTIDAVPDGAWALPSPCDGWTAIDVVRHLVTWIPGPGFLLGTFGLETDPQPSVDDDPAGAWAAVREAIQAGLDDPAVAGRVADCGPPGRLSFEAAVDMTCTPDVLIHTWDLAMAVGIPPVLDPDEVARQAAGLAMTPPELDAAMRASGHFGARVEVPPDADDLTRLLAFSGRRSG